MPVKELTVFKDGHAFVAREGSMPTDGSGNVLMDDLPTPVLGTFWPYSADTNARLTGTVASRHRVLVEKTALTLRELLEANVGADGVVTENTTNHYSATIVGIPGRSSEELEATSPPNAGEKLPEKGNLILLKTASGTKAVNIDRIQDFTFSGAHKATAREEEFRNLLTLKLNWERGKPAKTADVGLLYLQKGVRWIPNYKVSLDGKGQAAIKLQATLINELADLDDVSVNLVIGVPSFYFKDTIDPMALQQTLAQLSQYFQTSPNPALANNAVAYNFDNSIMTQQMARAGDYAQASRESPAPLDLGPEIADSKKNEDLYVFNVKHVTLKRGERMVLTIAEMTLPYKDVFTLDLPFGPPPGARRNFNSEQQRELAQLTGTPKVMHKVRLTNNGGIPLTTAPALIMREGRVLSQGLMTYVAPGAQNDLAVTTAVDIQVKNIDIETKRTPNAMTHDGTQYSRVDMNGKLTLASHRAGTIDVEVTRYVLGNVESAGQSGKIEKIDILEDEDALPPAFGVQGFGWNSYRWPDWWDTFNGVGRIKWNLKLEPGMPMELEYDWYYYWR
jgi:hypothetical protein